MDLKLKIFKGTNAGQDVTVTGPKFLIGRAEDCHLRPGSEMVSRHHCVIVVEQSYVAVRDFGSKNGTYVNGRRIAGQCELKPGDQLRVGPLEFEIAMRQGELGGKKKPPVHNPKQAAERTAAGQPGEFDVARWLDDPAGDAANVVDSRGVAAFDTQSIRLSETAQIAITRPAVDDDPTVFDQAAAEPGSPPAAAAPTGSAPTGAARPSANPPQRPLPTLFQMPAPEPEAPAPLAADKSGRVDKKKVFGKLPIQPQRPEDTRSAAAQLLDKLRRRS